MDFHISAEQRQMVASVRELAQAEFKPKAGFTARIGMSVPEDDRGHDLPIR